jgi:hypothetical protein
MRDEERLWFNGIDGRTGGYLLPPLAPGQVAELAFRARGDLASRRELRAWVEQGGGAVQRGPTEGCDPLDLAQSGWGVVFPASIAGSAAEAELHEALSPLLEHRRAQAARHQERCYRELLGADGYRTGEGKLDFLLRHGAGPGPADPQRLPYYLLLVGEPEETPFSFQYQLDVAYAVGRIAFDTPAEYRRYAESVVAAERGEGARDRRISFFAPANPDDPATALSRERLALPLAAALRSACPGWAVDALSAADATRDRLEGLLASGDRPALLFTACHGLGFPAGDPQQREHQGALLCQDWPGPNGSGLERRHYFAAEDLSPTADLRGLVAFCFACFGAGTPAEDDFQEAGSGGRRPLAPRPFVSRLAQRLLAHPRGGALALVGHVERAWTFSFAWTERGQQIAAFESCLRRLLAGQPVGWAMEPLNQRYAELATDLAAEVEALGFGKKLDERRLADLWTASRDARNYTIIGDPAVRLAVAAGGTT